VFYVRSRTTAAAAFTLARRTVESLDGSLPIYGMKTLESQLDETLLTDRLVALLSAGFGLLATMLASVGLYGVMAFVVARRRKELGVRIALGARPAVVQWKVMREVLTLLGLGLLVGVPTAAALGGYLGSQLYGIQPRDPMIGASMIALLSFVSILAGFIPAHRASRIDPIHALRHE
jgi:ABC-type antimicrobial peptide transport system permease subunit